MGNYTILARRVVKVHLEKYYDELKTITQDLANKGDFVSNAKSIHRGTVNKGGFYGDVKVAFVFGIAMAIGITDKSIHYRFAVESNEDGTVHAEKRVVDKLYDKWPDGPPCDLKVIVFLKKSPCRKCVEELPDQLYEFIVTWAQGKMILFSFVFDKYYLDGFHTYDNQGEADAAYSAINDDWRNVYVNNTTGQIRSYLMIRHVDQTKGVGTATKVSMKR